MGHSLKIGAFNNEATLNEDVFGCGRSSCLVTKEGLNRTWLLKRVSSLSLSKLGLATVDVITFNKLGVLVAVLARRFMICSFMGICGQEKKAES